VRFSAEAKETSLLTSLPLAEGVYGASKQRKHEIRSKKSNLTEVSIDSPQGTRAIKVVYLPQLGELWHRAHY
jgi:hypothetical protein